MLSPRRVNNKVTCYVELTRNRSKWSAVQLLGVHSFQQPSTAHDPHPIFISGWFLSSHHLFFEFLGPWQEGNPLAPHT